MNIDRYNKYSVYLKERFGEKIYKLPVNLPVTCPNRDGKISYGGCAFCGEKGAGFEMWENSLSVVEQLARNKKLITKKYKAKKFIAYFQNFCNTYLPDEMFESYVKEAAAVSDIIGISIATRADCLTNSQLEILKAMAEKYQLYLTIELGLQTVNYHTLTKVNRGHTLGEFIDAALRCQQYNIRVCAHVILNLPGDDMLDTIETAKVISALPLAEVKLHALYIVRDTLLADWYRSGEIVLVDKEEYIKRVVIFLSYLRKDIIVQRLIGRAPQEDTLFANWGTSWWLIQEKIENAMDEQNIRQGDLCDYLGGRIRA